MTTSGRIVIEADIRQGQAAAAAREGEVREGLDGQADIDIGYNSGFLELATKLDPSLRTSLIVDPLTDGYRL